MNFFYYSAVFVNFLWWYTTFHKRIQGVRASLVTRRWLLFPSLRLIIRDRRKWSSDNSSFFLVQNYFITLVLEGDGVWKRGRSMWGGSSNSTDFLSVKYLSLLPPLLFLIRINIRRLLVVILFGAFSFYFSFFFLEIVTDSFSTSSFPCETIIILF